MFQSWVWIPWGSRLETYAEFLCCCLENFFFRKPLYLPLRLLSFWIRQSYSFSSSHIWMRELDPKEGWVLKNWCFWIMVLEKTLESPLDWKEIKPLNPKGNQSWIFIGRTDAEAPILWSPDAKNWLIGKDTDAGKDWKQEEKRMKEDEMVGWHPSLTQWTWVWASSGRW